MVYLTFSTVQSHVCAVCHLSSRVNQRLKMQVTKRLKIEMHLEIREEYNYCMGGVR